MKKIVYFFVPMKNISPEEKADFSGTGNVKTDCTEKVCFGFVAALSGKISAEDDVKVVIVKTVTENRKQNESSDRNIGLFKDEFSRVLKRDCNPEIIEAAFSETKTEMEDLYRAMLSKLEEGCEIYADTTFGPRMNLMVTMNVLNFAERFFDADIKMILNVKALFDPNTHALTEGSQALFDASPFYYLNNLTSTMEAPDGESALKALDSFFKL